MSWYTSSCFPELILKDLSIWLEICGVLNIFSTPRSSVKQNSYTTFWPEQWDPYLWPYVTDTGLHHDTETLSTLLALCEGNPPMTGGFPSQRASNAELIFAFLLAWTNCWENTQVACDLRCHDAELTSQERRDLYPWPCVAFVPETELSHPLISNWLA